VASEEPREGRTASRWDEKAKERGDGGEGRKPARKVEEEIWREGDK